MTLILVVGTMLALSWQITVASLLLLPIFLAPTKWIGGRLQGYTRDSFEINAQMSSTMTERFNVSGALLVKLYGDLDQESQVFKKKARKVADIGISMAMLNTFFFIALISIASLATAIAYGIGGHLAIDGAITVGSLIAITTLLARLYGPLVALATVRVDVMGALVSFERVFEVLDLEPMVQEKANAQVLKSRTPAIEFQDVHFTYPNAQQISLASLEAASMPEVRDSEEILKGITFSALPGTVTALVGPSGAGKTTLVDVLLGVLKPKSGEITISGVDPLTSISNWPGAISYVPQDVVISNGTIRENVALGYPLELATDDLVMRALKVAHLDKFIEELPFGIDTQVGERGAKLSGGQRQRLGIARAMFTQPHLLVLDEATSSLDGETEANITDAIHDLRGKTTVVMIAHRLSTIRNADIVIYLSKGTVMAVGAFDQVRNAVPDFDHQAKLMGL